MKRHMKVAGGVLAATLLVAGCGATTPVDAANSGIAPEASTATTATTGDATAAGSTVAGVDVDWGTLPTTETTLTDEGVSITEAGTYVLTGSTTGQVVVDSDSAVRLILDGVTIASTDGAAIQVDGTGQTVLELADGSTNTVSDAATRTEETIDAAIYAASDLSITGTGSLAVTANFANGIVGSDSLSIDDGTITVDAAEDGLKSSNDTDIGKGELTISGGNVTISAGDDAINAEQAISITGGSIDIPSSVEGIEAPVIVIDDATISLNASDDGINASASEIVTSGLSITINGGDISITMASGDTDAIDSNGDLTITGGTLDITAQSPFDFDGTGSLTGATVTVNGEPVTTLSNQMMGGGGGRP